MFFFLLHMRSLLISCAYVSIESIDCILLSSFELKAIFLISSVKTLCLSHLNLCYDFNSNLFFMNSFLSSLRLLTWIPFFSKCIINCVCNLTFFQEIFIILKFRLFFLQHTSSYHLPFYINHCCLLNNCKFLVVS